MGTFKIVIADPRTRKAYQKEVEQETSGLLGRKIQETVSGAGLGLDGYSLELTGGSDTEGFPMRRDVDGSGRAKIVLSHPPGFHPERKGQRKRKSVRGNTISKDIAQINAKVTVWGKKTLENVLGKPKEKAAKGAEAASAAGKPKEEVKKEERPAEKSDEGKPEPKEGPGREAAEKKMGVKTLE